MSLIKQLIAPIQAKLLEKKQCPACTRNLDKQKPREPFAMGTDIVFCKCNRAFIYDREHDEYRRALHTEVMSLPGMKNVKEG